MLAKNFGGIPLVSDICQLLCALQNNKQLRSEISKSLTNANSKDESCESASGAAQCGHIQKASQSEIEADGSVRGDVVQQQCEDQMELIQAAENGCAEMETRIGRTATDLSESQSVMSHSKRSGGDGSLPEMDTPARSAGANRNHRVNSTRTMSNGGATSRNSDLKSLMDELYANLATRGRTVDLLTAGFPCQPYSLAGQRRGASDDRALWPRLFEVIEILRPAFCLLENVAGIVSMELDQVLSDLESIGYACRTFIIPACGVDAPHRRNRVWIVGHAGRERDNKRGGERRGSKSTESRHQPERSGKHADDVADSHKLYAQRSDDNSKKNRRGSVQRQTGLQSSCDSRPEIWLPEPDVCRVAHGVPNRVDRLKALGNAIVPAVAYQILKAIYDIDNALVTNDEST